MTTSPQGTEQPPLTEEELQAVRDLFAALAVSIGSGYREERALAARVPRLLAEVDRLRAMKCATCGKRIGYINHKGHLLGWGCADGEECEQGLPHRFDTERGEVLVEGSWFKVEDLPDILGNFMRASVEYGREAKRYAMEIGRLKAELAAVDELHQPYDTPDDPHASRRCKGCIAGYDPRTGGLVHCAWPCPTKAARAALGEDGGTDA